MPKKSGKKNATAAVASLWEFMKCVSEIGDQWDDDEGRPFMKWYRGHNDTSWSLVPGFYRRTAGVAEDTLRHEFALRAHPYLAGITREPQTDWDWYFVMQHHGLPTRLLDWTESALVALYFALRDATTDQTPTIWVLDPWSLNSTIGGVGDQILYTTDTEAAEYLPSCFSHATLPEPPIALAAPFHSRRITAQKGTFTLHGSSERAINEYENVRLTKIEIESSARMSVRRDLTRLGITETTVFPELPGLSRELLDYWYKYSG